LKGEIRASEEKLRGEINTSEQRVMGEIKRLDERFASLDKRLANEEVISRSAFGAIIAGIVVALAKYLFFPGQL
ncbi:MAG: hypothetical protein NZL92_06545, partial [Gloeomargarita sp. SKYG116]|nr:hypothetical protein [Gloeomargarita sp. SKYG116]MDW8401339.1 hypothetical protein [Gloeomargarita sp. SKYGB_i_bin116]